MNAERKLSLVYLLLGLFMGTLSVYVDKLVSVGIGAGLYIVSFFIVKRIVKEQKKTSWYVTNTLITYLLVWIVSWIFLFNM